MTTPATSQGGLTASQSDVCAELFRMRMGINCCFEDADLILDQLHVLYLSGESSVTILRWLNMLPRVTDRVALQRAQGAVEKQLTLLTPLAGKPMPAPHRLMDPDMPRPAKPGPRAERAAMRRPPTGVCVDCSKPFEMNPFGRPATRCPEHRRSAPSGRAEETA